MAREIKKDIVSNLPTKLIICGLTYKISYYNNALEVDRHKDRLLDGQIDEDLQEIRINTNRFGKRHPQEFIWQTILHETLHAIADTLIIKSLTDKNEDFEDEINRLANALTAFLFNNNILKLEAK